MRLCIVVSSIGKANRLQVLLDSLVSQTDKDFSVGICDQSDHGRVTVLAALYQDRLDIFTTNSSPGLSAGRNSVIRSAPPDSTHFIFPNDTTTLPSTFVAKFRERHFDSDVVAFRYLDKGSPRYVFDDGSYPLSMHNVWRVIEPAMALSKRVIQGTGGFDERLGTGCTTPWQSGEGTDLLLKLTKENMVVRWDNELHVIGVPESYGLDRASQLAKLRAYGRGYGYLHSKWSYPILTKIKICVTPWVRLLVGGSSMGISGAAAVCLGRIEGLVGRQVAK